MAKTSGTRKVSPTAAAKPAVNMILDSSLTHEFINIMTGISGFAQVLEVKVTDPQQLQFVAAIRQLSDRGSQLLRNLRSFASEGGSDKMHVFNPNDLLNNMVPLLKSLVPEDLKLEFCLDKRNRLICGNHEVLREAVMTLVVLVSKSLPDYSLLTVSSIVPAGVSGAGDPEAVIRIESSVSPVSRGGFEEITEKVALSLRGVGSELKLEYPAGALRIDICLSRQAIVKDVNATLGALPKGGETIMVVDDEGAILAVCENILERLGYKIIACNSPESAMEHFREGKEKIDLLLTDVIMPNWNGQDLYRQLVRVQPGLKVVFMSGYTNRGIVQDGLLVDGTPILEKPFKVTSLAAAVRNALDN